MVKPPDHLCLLQNTVGGLTGEIAGNEQKVGSLCLTFNRFRKN